MASPYPPVTSSARPWAPHWSMARGLLAGMLTGAALGIATLLVSVLEASGHDPDPAALLYLGFAAVVGAVAGTLCSLVSTGLVLLARVFRPFGIAAARAIGAIGAAAPVAVFTLAAPASGLIGMAMAAASAAVWMRWVVGVPRSSATVAG